MGWLASDVAIVTGGASGLGLAIARRFVEEGARVTVFDKSSERVAEAVAGDPSRIHGCVGDVRSLADNCRAVAETQAKFGKLNTFVGNAGVWDYSTSLHDLPDDRIELAFDEIINVNLKGYLLGAKAAAAALAETEGSLIFTLSNAAFHPGGGGPIYTASKHAAVGLIRQLAFELAPKVRVNGVAPAAVPTDLRGPSSLGLQERSLANVPLKEMVEGLLPVPFLPSAADYTGHYVLLASHKNSKTMTGATLEADCGFGVRGFRPKA
ncbi:MAG: 3-(cis-5,6-dihydroxycyclohexa-1,3-dien-1-yl)propanoate dehydrogenase [Hyphomonadaceae bacterium]|nr:3-(cis-5,6-dihydroxycyclohexa-1,3-dien-1-yl)propanoate dehydrogenase [Hyphomonadaceae bacterium]